VGHGTEPVDIEGIRSALLAWYAHSGRVLPWRDERHDPYRVLVCETMLVQTTVSAVIPFYHRFLERFPTIESLAEAPEADVLKQWEGLGYYRRARQLHALAKTVTERFAGSIPAEESELLSLPGVGRYIAGAIRSFAFDRPAPILEANTIRLIARLIGLPEDVTSTSAQKRLWETAAQLVPEIDPGTFNQAMMDLGSTVCTPRNPACSACPLADRCISFRKGLTESIPVRPARKPPTPGEEAAIIVQRPVDRSILLVRRPEEGLWSSFWELPTFWISGADPAQRAVAGAVVRKPGDVPELARMLFGITLDGNEPEPAPTVKYAVTRYEIRLHLICCQVVKDESKTIEPECPAGWKEARFVNFEDSAKLTMPSAHRKALRSIWR